jgi:hypothetical protein
LSVLKNTVRSGGKLQCLIISVSGRSHENEVRKPHVHHAPGHSTDIVGRFGVHENDADIIEG